MHSYLKKKNFLSPGPTLCFSLSLTLANLFLARDGDLLLWRHPGVLGHAGARRRGDTGLVGATLSSMTYRHPVPGSAALALTKNHLRPGSQRRETGLFKKEFIAQLNMKDILWNLGKALLWPEDFLPAKFQESAVKHAAAGTYKKKKKAQETPPAWRAGQPNGSCWDNMRGYDSSPVIF